MKIESYHVRISNCALLLNMDFLDLDYEANLQWRKDMWYAVFVATSIFGTVGNCLIIWIIMAHKTMQTKLNIFIVNMALSDLMVSFGSIPLEAYQLLYQKWIFGTIACTIQEIIETIGLCVFVLALCMATIEVHYSILPKANSIDTKIMTTLEIWISSILLSAPNWIFATLSLERMGHPKCIQIWPDAENGNSLQQIYSLFFIIIVYNLPLIYMFYRFGRLIINIWVIKHWPTSAENKQNVKMIFVMVLVYAISALPFRWCSLFENTCLKMFFEDTDDDLFDLPFVWLAVGNVIYNPIILLFFSKKFRLGFKKAFRWLPFIYYNANNELEGATDPVIMRFLSTPGTW